MARLAGVGKKGQGKRGTTSKKKKKKALRNKVSLGCNSLTALRAGHTWLVKDRFLHSFIRQGHILFSTETLLKRIEDKRPKMKLPVAESKPTGIKETSLQMHL